MCTGCKNRFTRGVYGELSLIDVLCVTAVLVQHKTPI